MSRRSGQNGHIVQKDGWYRVRFYIDEPGKEKRTRRSEKICPISGPGKLTKPERERRAREIIAASGADSEEHFNRVEAISSGTTFRQQAEWWLNQMQTRKRKPVKPKTVASWQDCLRKWLNPNLGDMPLASINNFAVKELVSKMALADLKPKTICNYVQVVKMVVASVINDQGEQVYPRRWNHGFLDLPEVKNQRRPTFTTEEVSAVVSAAEGQHRVLYAFLGGTGLRIGEALGLPIEHICDNCTRIRVRQSVWGARVQTPKTYNAIREIDLHPDLAAMLRQFIGDRKNGLLFCTKRGRPLSQQNILNRNLNPILETTGMGRKGFHAFRRFRTTWLRKNRVPEDLLRFWIGHANKTVTDAYCGLKYDVEFRKQVAKEVGIGFQLADKIQVGNGAIGPDGPETTPDRVAA